MVETSQSDHGRRADPRDVAGDASWPRVDALIASMPLRAKLAQLVGLWAGARRGDDVAPMQEQLLDDTDHLARFAADGLGQLTRHWGTTPIPVEAGLAALADRQRGLIERVGVAAVVHEECLTGVLALGATAYPTPLAWGAAWSPELVHEMAGRIGADLRALGVHQGLAPVLDVVRDPRWGRVEECIGEDPLLVGLIGEAYVRGIEGAGVVATLKHFAGYSASRGARNLAPVSIGPRELADVILPPFERAIRAGARSVMNSYADVDGVPAAAAAHLLTGVLRDDWGFDGTVVADYFAVTMLHTMHGVAGDAAEAAALALRAGLDVELPTGSAYLDPLEAAVRDGRVDEALVDRALRRVLRQKAQLGLLDAETAVPPVRDVDLDSPGNRDVARRLAEASVVLVENDGLLPLALDRSIAIIGPNADRFGAVFGCYSFVKHVLPRHPGVDAGIAAPTVAAALRALVAEAGGPSPVVVAGCGVTGDDRSGFADAVAAAADAEVAVVVLGDDAGMFGKGTSGEGCDVAELRLPGVQPELLEAVLATGTPVVLVLITGRPYALGDEVDRCAAIVQAFLPGEEGGPAVADVLVGIVNPSGRLPVEIPRPGTPQPSGTLRPRLAGPTGVSAVDPSPRVPFGFGRSYTSFAYGPLELAAASVGVDGVIEATLRVTNTGDRAGADVLQLYVEDEVAQVVRPLRSLLAFRRVELEPGQTQTWSVSIPVAATAFTGIAGRRIVEPGRFGIVRAVDAADAGDRVPLDVVGDELAVPVVADAPVWRRMACT